MFKSIKEFIKKLFSKSSPPLSGWIPDEPDVRDYIFVVPENEIKKRSAPQSADLSDKFGPIESQGNINSCVGHSVTSVVEAILGVKDKSRLFVYYNAREVEWRTGTDSGCSIRSAISALSKRGASDELLWPYDASKVLVRPSVAAYTDGLSVPPKILSYERVTTLSSLKAALNAGLPVVFGFKVYSSFRTQTATTGICPYPAPGEAQIGSHAVVAVGYNDTTGMVKCRNSFGPTWGQSGYFYMPYQWFSNMTSLVSDAWVIRPKV